MPESNSRATENRLLALLTDEERARLSPSLKRVSLHRGDVIFRMVSDVSQLAEWQKFADDRRLSVDLSRTGDGDKLDGPQRARRQLDRDLRFVESLLEGCDALAEILGGALARFNAMIAEVDA